MKKPEQENEGIDLNEKISDITHEKILCTNCYRDLSDETIGDVFVDPFLFDWFRYIFCNEQCRDAYINSK